MIKTQEDMLQLIRAWGCVPLFANSVKGWSIEEHTDPSIWFQDNVEGPWDWKGPIAQQDDIVYGKFFKGKAGFMTIDLYAQFANYRRDGYDFDSRIDEKLVTDKEILLYREIKKHKRITTPELMAWTGYEPNKKSAFETIITKLQMSGYVIIDNFAYRMSKSGQPYGWGIAVYTLPEIKYGVARFHRAYKQDPQDALNGLIKKLSKRIPDIDPVLFQRLLA